MWCIFVLLIRFVGEICRQIQKLLLKCLEGENFHYWTKLPSKTIFHGNFVDLSCVYFLTYWDIIIICDLPSKNQPSLHLVAFQEIPFWNIQSWKADLSLVLCLRTYVFNSKILSYLLAFIIANLLYLWWLNFMVFFAALFCCQYW